MFPVRYELELYIIFRRNSVFKGVNLPSGIVPLPTCSCPDLFGHTFIINVHYENNCLLSAFNLL
jgi:hypothetical protein